MATYNIPNNLEPGEHTLKVEASSDGLTTSTTIPFTINELLEKPAARLVLDQDDLFAYNTVHIDGSTSYQTGGSIIKYEWSTGETTPAIDLKLEHEDTEISLTVTGEDSQTSTVTYPISLIPNTTELGEYEVLKQNEKYPTYFVDKFGTFEENVDIKGTELKIPFGGSWILNLRDTERNIKGIDKLSCTICVPDRASETLSSGAIFGKIHFKNGYIVSLGMYHHSSTTKCYFSTSKGSVTFEFRGTGYVPMYKNYTMHQIGKSLEITCEGYGTKTLDVSDQKDLGGIEKIEFFAPSSKNTSDDVMFFYSGSYLGISNLVLSEIPAEAPIVTCVTDSPEEVEYGTVCTLTASANQFESSFLWSTGETTQSIKVTPKKTTEYSCTITNDSGVSGIGYVTQQVIPYAPFAIIGANGLKDGVLNAGISEMVIIRSESYSPVDLELTYKWYLDDDLISTNKNIRLMGKSGTVKLVVEDELGNIEETSIILELTDNPTRKNIDLKRMNVYDKAVKNYVDKHVIPKASLDDIEDLFD